MWPPSHGHSILLLPPFPPVSALLEKDWTIFSFKMARLSAVALGLCLDDSL